MLSSRPASARRRVSATSSSEGAGSPEGCVCQTISACALSRIALLKTSDGSTSACERAPRCSSCTCSRRLRASSVSVPNRSTRLDPYERGEVIRHHLGPVEQRLPLQREAREPPPHLERRGDDRALGGPDPLGAQDHAAVRGRQAGEAARLGQELLGQRQHVGPRGAGAQQQREQLGVRERLRAQAQQLLPRPFLARELRDAHAQPPPAARPPAAASPPPARAASRRRGAPARSPPG